MGIVLVSFGKIDKEIIGTLKEMPEPHYAFNKKRNQYLSTAILNTFKEQKEYASYERILGIVDHDLYVHELNFVFGEASRKVVVISLIRLRQDFYALPEDRNLFQKRVLTEAIHESGHTYGLCHCENPKCVMFFPIV